MDAAEEVPPAGGGHAFRPQVVDECSGAVLRAVASPRPGWTKILPSPAQVELRRASRRRGLPERLRVDNGTPRGSRGDLPSTWRRGGSG